MRWLLLVVLLGNTTFAQDITKYQWKNRVVVIFGNGDNDPKVKEQLHAFKPYPAEIADREMIILTLRTSEEKPKLLKRLGLNENYSGLLLVGKDGGIKLQEKLVVHPEALFRLIDAMPMRRMEVRNKPKKSG